MSTFGKDKPHYKPLSSKEIFYFARLVRKLSRSPSNIIVAFQELRQIFPKLRFKVVDDNLMPHEEARAYPRSWLIWIRRSIYEGLVRGRVRGRWTLVHELAHVLFQHPRRQLPRSETVKYSKSNRIYEREANLFAAGFLAPFEMIENCKSAAEIKSIARISLEAAQFRLQELNVEIIRKREAISAGLPELTYAAETAHPDNLEELVAQISQAIGISISREIFSLRKLFEPAKNNLVANATVIVAGSQLLLKAYSDFRRQPVHDICWRVAALVETALLLRPIRLTEDQELYAIESNQRCALQIAATLLDVPVAFDRIRLPHPNPWGSCPFESSYLKSFILDSVGKISHSGAVLSLSALLDERDYRAENYLCEGDLRDLEFLFDVFSVMRDLGKEGCLR